MTTPPIVSRLRALARALGAFFVAALVLAGCDAHDAGSADAPARAVAEAGGAAPAHVVVPPNIDVKSGVSLDLLVRGTAPQPIEATFKFRYDRAMQVRRLEDLSDVVMARLTIEEGGSAGWHRHHGSAVIVVQSGTFGVIEETDCVVRTYGPTYGPDGSVDLSNTVAFHRGGGILDVGFNAGTGDMVAYVTFLGTPAGHSPTADEPEASPCSPLRPTAAASPGATAGAPSRPGVPARSDV